ncbi:MAG: alanine racemase [Candidatus Binatia bacterium]
MFIREPRARHLTKAFIHLENLTHNLRLLQMQVGAIPLWPVLKANAYGHDAQLVGPHLLRLGYRTLCVADVDEAIALAEAGMQATFIVLSATLPHHSEALVAYRCEPAVGTLEMAAALNGAAARAQRRLAVHLMVDTGMGRFGIAPAEVEAFLDRCGDFPWIQVRGLMSHFPRADEADTAYSYEQFERFCSLFAVTRRYGIQVHHIANSAAIFTLPNSYCDAVRPGIAIYGLRPSATTANPRVQALKPVLEWKTRIAFLKEVPAGTGLSYGHTYHTTEAALIATLPIGYGDGLNRTLSNRLHVLVRGVRCPQVGRITMDMSLIDVTALRGQVELGDEVVIIGRQGANTVTADELAALLGTINYEVVTCISHRVPRVLVAVENS